MDFYKVINEYDDSSTMKLYAEAILMVHANEWIVTGLHVWKWHLQYSCFTENSLGQ